MRSPTLPPGSRFFARVDQFHCECPHCGVILLAKGTKEQRKVSAQPRIRHSQQRSAYNPLTSTLRCPSCGHVYQVGIILWPVGRGPWSKDRRIPQDQKPTRDQMRQLRQRMVGWIAEQQKAKGEEVNVYITAECGCPLGGWAPGCAIHGWDEESGKFRGEDQDQE